MKKNQSIIKGIIGGIILLYAVSGIALWWISGTVPSLAKEIMDKGKIASVEQWEDWLSSLKYRLVIGRASAAIWQPFRFLPKVGQQLKTAFYVTTLGEGAVRLGEALLSVAAHAVNSQEPLVGQLTKMSFKQLAGNLDDTVVRNLDKSALLMGQGATGLLNTQEQLPGELKAFGAYLPIIRQASMVWTGSVTPWLKYYSSLAGYDGESNYLIMIQNSSELRPTGGFFGTYSFITMKEGKLIKFVTDNIYSLDYNAKDKMNKIAPPPLQKYVKQWQWFLRDANWYPDFPTSARQVIDF
ncbi:MAG: DUF4012 domain-containing protein, partial [bacterium]